MIDGTIQPAAGGAPSTNGTIPDELAKQGFALPDKGAGAIPDELAKQGFALPEKVEGFRSVLTPEQRQAATRTMADRNAARRASVLPPGFEETDKLDVYTDDELLERPDFNTEDYLRQNQDKVNLDPKRLARLTELHRKAKQRGMQWGTLGKGIAHAAGQILASPFGAITYTAKALAPGSVTDTPRTVGEGIPSMIHNIGRTVATGAKAFQELDMMPVGAGRRIGRLLTGETPEAAKARELSEKREQTEALIGTVADAAGLAKTVEGIGQKSLRALHLTDQWEDMSPDEVQTSLRAGAADKDALEELSRGEVVALEPTTTELAVEGAPIRPEEIARAQEGGLASWLAYGQLFGAIHSGSAAAKKWVNNTDAGKLADGLARTKEQFSAAEGRALGFATKENVTGLGAAEQALAAATEAVKASPTARALAAVDSAKAALARMTQAAAAGTVEKVGQALQLPEKLLHKLPGVSTFGTIAGMFTGGMKGAVTALAARLGAAATAKVGQGVEAAGKAAAPGVVSRSVAMSRAGDIAQAFNDSVGKALGLGGLGMDVGTALATAPEGETPSEVPVFMGTMRLMKGIPVGLRRVAGGELVSKRTIEGPVPTDPAYGQNRALDAAHDAAMRLAGPDTQNQVNFVRALGRKLGGQVYLLDPETAPGVIVEAYRQRGQEISLEAAQKIAQANAVFKTDLPDADGNMTRVVFSFGERGLTHDVGHLIQAAFPESVNRSIDALIGKQYSPEEIQSFAEQYTRALVQKPDGTRLTPEETAGDGWRNWLQPFIPKNLAGSDPAQTYILRELGAENINKTFDSRATAAGEKPGLYRTLAYGIAGVAEMLGVNLLGQTELGFGTPVRAEVQRAQEVALSDIVAKNPRGAIIEVEARRGAAARGKGPGGSVTEKQDRAINRAVEQATNTPPPVDAVVPGAEAQTARQITEVIAEMVRRGGGMLKAWYRTAPGSTDAALSSAAPVSEVKARKAAIEAARTLPESERPLWERLFFAYGLTPSSRGPQVLTWNPMTFAANAVRWAKSLSAAGAVAESPYPIVNGKLTPDGWRQLRNDLQVASRNYLSGYAGSGVELGAAAKPGEFEPMVKAAGYRVPEKTTPSPEQLPQDRADVINYLLAPDTTPTTARIATPEGQIPMNVIGQKVSEATIPGRISAIPGAPVYTGPAAQTRGVEGVSVKEVNPFRAKMRQLGVAPELFSVLQRLNVEHLAKVEAAPEQPVIASNILTAAAGFSPRASELIGGQFSPEGRDDVPRVRAAAMRDKTTGKIYTGFMHAMAWDRIFDALGPVEGVKGLEDYAHPNFQKVMDRFERGFAAVDPGKEGFRFVSPDEAKAIGEASGQLEANRDRGEKGLQSEELFGYQASPAADRIREMETMTAEDFQRGPRNFAKGRFGAGPSGWALQTGSEATERSDAASMRSTYEVLRMAAQDAQAAKDIVQAMDFITRAQLAREAYETATGEKIDGSAGEPGALREARKYEADFQPPLGGEMVRPTAKPAEAPEIPIEPAGEVDPKAKVFAEGRDFAATSEKGQALEARGFEFRLFGQPGVRSVEVWKDGTQVAEVSSSGTKTPGRVNIDRLNTNESFRKQGIGEALYRELANVLQEDGATEIEGMAVHPSVVSLRNKVFGTPRIETGEGIDMPVERVKDYIREGRESNQPFYAETLNAIRPRSEGQYSAKKYSDYDDPAGIAIFRDNILEALDKWQARGTVDQLKSHLAKFKGTKEEAEWTGLTYWLDKRKAEGKTVTKGEVEDFIVANQVKFKEVQLEEGEEPSWSEGEYDHESWGGVLPMWDYYDRGGETYGSVVGEARNQKALEEAYQDELPLPEPDVYYVAYSSNGVRMGSYDTPDAAKARVEDRYTGSHNISEEGFAKYAKWTEPGGKNYREILITLPDLPKKGSEEAEQNFADYKAELNAAYPLGWRRNSIISAPVPGLSILTQAETDKLAALKSLRDPVDMTDPSHWDETPNIVAHLRVKDRRDADNEGVLFLEEIQSDWHSEGAKVAYESEKMPAEEQRFIEEKFDFLNKVVGRADEAPVLNPADFKRFGVDPGIGREEAYETKEALYAELVKAVKANKGAVPDAPFKGGGWVKLALKRALIEAARGGDKWLAWTTGAAQRDRYNLGKHVSSVTYHKQSDGTYSVEFWGRGGEQSKLVYEMMDKPIEEVARVAGNDLARQIEAGEGALSPYASTAETIKRGKVKEVFAEGEDRLQWRVRFESGEEQGVWDNEVSAKAAMDRMNDLFDNLNANPRRELTAEQLVLGGQGKLNLYDKQMVNVANDLAKDYGAKVEKKEVRGTTEGNIDAWAIKIPDSLRKFVREIGFTQFSPKGEEKAGDDMVRPARAPGQPRFGATSPDPAEGQFGPKGPDELGFFSAARKVVEEKMPNRAGAAQIKAILSPNNGVKPDEMKWTGLDDFLAKAAAENRPVDKAEVLEFIDTNSVNLKEHWRAKPETRRETMPPGVYEETGPKWAQYTQKPRGEYYREIVWTWENPQPGSRADKKPYTHATHWGRDTKNPIAHARVTDRKISGKKTLFIEELQSDWHGDARRKGYFDPAVRKAEVKEEQRLADEANKAKAARDDFQQTFREARDEAIRLANDSLQNNPEFVSLTDAVMEAKQNLRDATPENLHYANYLVNAKDNARNEFINRFINKNSTEEAWAEASPVFAEANARFLELQRAFTSAQTAFYQADTAGRKHNEKNPQAPFSKSWREVFFRRLVNYAARMGYDSISWTTGAQQAGLYETALRSVVDTVRWEPITTRLETQETVGGDSKYVEVPADEGSFRVTATKNNVVKFQQTFGKDGMSLTPLDLSPGNEKAKPQPLSDVIGSGVAEKILAAPEGGSLSDENLAVGAKWMQDVYDVILPEYARKFGKKFGSTVELTPIGKRFHETVKRAPGRRPPAEHPGLFEEVDVYRPSVVRKETKPPFTAWTMNITPEMRKSVVETGTAQYSPKAKEGGFKIEPVRTAWGDFPNAVMHTSIAALQKDQDYPKAKAGDAKAAVRAVRRAVKPDRAAALAENFPGALLLPVRADEAKGRNALPAALAVVLSRLTGLDVAPGIVQASRAFHTGATDAQRVERRAEFTGPVEKGGKYILLDDVSTSGSTLAALRAFIRRNGGEVVGVSVLGAAHRPDRGHGSHVALRDETLAELKKLDSTRLSATLQRYGIENIEDLSNGEARILLREARRKIN